MFRTVTLTLVLLALLAGGCAAGQRTLVVAPPKPIRLATPRASSAGGDTQSTSTAAVDQQRALLAQLQNWGQARELTNEVWINSPPLRLADLHGKVVMVEFWTFGCINCQHVTPTLQEWHQKYADQGLVIIGIHTPEFGYEEDVENVKAATIRMGVTWPVALDNNRQTWNAYGNRFWPAMYVIDKQGNTRYLSIGEGNYQTTEAVLQALLAE